MASGSMMTFIKPFKTLTDYFGSGDVKQTTPSSGSPGDDSIYLDPKSVEISRERYRVKLGEGAFARVYEGRYRGQPCAVKVFKENVLKNKDEMAYLCGLKSSNIVKTHGLWFDPYKDRNALSLVMELCDTSLYEYVKSHKARGIPKRDKLKILHDVTNAMIYLHIEHSIVHGDLRSPNVLLVNTRSRVESSDDQPQITAKVADFDLARHVDPKTLTHYTTTFADEDYLPPEAIDEENFKDKKYVRLTFSVDVFCFGPLAIELACMEFPKPAVKVEHKKGKVVKQRDEIERRERYLKKIDYSERMYTDLIVKQCMADRPEDRGSFLDLQLIIEAFQRKMQDRPDQELLEEKQAEIFDMRRKMEEDARTLVEQEVRLVELENQFSKQEVLIKDTNRVRLHLIQELEGTKEECERLKRYEEQCKKSEDEVKVLRANEEKSREMETLLRTDRDKAVRSKRELEDEVKMLMANLKKTEKTKQLLKGQLDKMSTDLEKVKCLKEEAEFKQKKSENEQKIIVAELSQKVKTLETSKVAAEKELRETKQLNLQMTQEREVLSREKTEYLKCRETMEEMKAQNARLQETLDHDSLFGELRDEMVKLGKGVKEDVKDVDEMVRESMKKIHEEHTNSQARESENISLKMKLAVKSGELDQAKKELADIIQRDRAKSKEKEERLIGEMKKHQDKMKQELVHLFKKQQDDDVDKEKLSATVEDLTKQLEKEKKQLESTKSKMEEMSHKHALALTERDSTENNLQNALTIEREAVANLQNEVAQLKRCLEEVSQEHNFKQAQSSKLVRDMEEMINLLIKQRDERISTEMEEELRDENARLREDLRETQSVVREESTRAMKLQRRHTEVLALKVPRSDLHVVQVMHAGPSVHEAELKKFCWIPFGIQTLTVGQEGGLFPLQPQSKGLSEDRDVIMLEVPENAVNTAVCDELCIRYGVIVYGPFDVPEGYQLGSMAVYIYFEENHTVKPVLLHLPHWSGKDGESSLKCAIAPHRLEEGEEKYKFRLTEDGDFHSTEGSGVIAIDGHCSLFAKALKQKASLRYYATGLEKEVKDGVNLYVLITYASQVWLQILERYRSATSLTEPAPFKFDHEFIQGSVTPEGGSGWEARVNVNHVVHREDVEYKSHGIEDASDMEGAVKRRAYPPFLSCQTTYSKEVKKTGEPTKAVLAIEGAKDKVMNFPCTAYKNKSAECKSPVLQSVSPSPTSPGHRQLSPSKDFTVQNLMPYIRKLAPSGQQIAGYLDRTDDWDNIVLSHQDPVDRLQELLKRWLADSEDEKCPHSWDGFISIVKAIGEGKLAEKIISEVHEEPTTNEGK